MRKKTKDDLKQIFREIVKESTQNEPLILANRPPTEEDTYSSGTIWKHGGNMYECVKIRAEWEPKCSSNKVLLKGGVNLGLTEGQTQTFTGDGILMDETTE